MYVNNEIAHFPLVRFSHVQHYILDINKAATLTVLLVCGFGHLCVSVCLCVNVDSPQDERNLMYHVALLPSTLIKMVPELEMKREE